MANDRYLMTKVSECLLSAGGDRKRAQQHLLDTAAHDPRLLNALVAPFLPNIAARVVNRICDQAQPPNRSQPEPAHPTSAQSRAGLSADDLETIIGQLGTRIGSVPVPNGLEALLRPAVQPKASQQHADSIRRIAVAHARKRLDQSA